MRNKNEIVPPRIKVVLILATLVALVIPAGCGTTPLVLKPSDPQIDFTRYRSIAIETTGQGLSLSRPAQARIADFVKAEVFSCCAQRFESVITDTAQPHDLVLRVKVTVYEEGNRFARFMLAGLGSMQIHAQVELTDSKSGNLLNSGDAGKTFAWGGIYGASVGIEDLEKDFAKEVVKGLQDAMRLGSPTS